MRELGSGGMMPCRHESRIGSGGVMPCNLPDNDMETDFLRRLEPYEEPLRKHRQYRQLLERIKKEGTLFTGINPEEKIPPETKLPRLDILTERLFSGGKHITETDKEQRRYLIVDAPAAEGVELAVLELPIKPAQPENRQYLTPKDHLHIIFEKGVDFRGSPIAKFGINIPLSPCTEILPENLKSKYAHIYRVHFGTGINALQHHAGSYSSLNALQRGVMRIIRKYANK